VSVYLNLAGLQKKSLKNVLGVLESPVSKSGNPDYILLPDVCLFFTSWSLLDALSWFLAHIQPPLILHCVNREFG